MLYPLKFQPVYKSYLWGGRKLEQFGKTLPEGIVAESWEISCHPSGVSIISNGEYAGTPLTGFIGDFGSKVVGTALPDKDLAKFPLLVKLIDANDRLSVQVHPDDAYASSHENGELGKNEMWYILEAKPGAELIYDIRPGTTKADFAQAVSQGVIESRLKKLPVSPGDVINIPAGLVHAIGAGIILAEIQQNSDTTYRVYDYDRIDANGDKRPLHIEKALEVIDFNSRNRREKAQGLIIEPKKDAQKKYLVANPYFAVELDTVRETLDEIADGSKFYIYFLTEGSGEILYNNGSIPVTRGESILIPASLGAYTLKGKLKALKAYVPDLANDIIAPLKQAGYSEAEIYDKVSGLHP
jgi:mannose-6-phosphate isomerase